MIDADKAVKAMANMENIMTAVRATGGYRFRELVRAPDHELEAFVAGASGFMRAMTVRLLAAEEVIERWGREGEYRQMQAVVRRALDGQHAEEVPPALPGRVAAPNRFRRRHMPKRNRTPA